MFAKKVRSLTAALCGSTWTYSVFPKDLQFNYLLFLFFILCFFAFLFFMYKIKVVFLRVFFDANCKYNETCQLFEL